MSDDETSTLRSSSKLARLADHVAGWLSELPEIERAIGARGALALDAGVLRRTLRVYGEMTDDVPILAEELRRWQGGALSASQGATLAELATQLMQIRGAVDSLLARAVGLR